MPLLFQNSKWKANQTFFEEFFSWPSVNVRSRVTVEVINGLAVLGSLSTGWILNSTMCALWGKKNLAQNKKRRRQIRSSRRDSCSVVALFITHMASLTVLNEACAARFEKVTWKPSASHLKMQVLMDGVRFCSGFNILGVTTDRLVFHLPCSTSPFPPFSANTNINTPGGVLCRLAPRPHLIDGQACHYSCSLLLRCTYVLKTMRGTNCAVCNALSQEFWGEFKRLVKNPSTWQTFCAMVCWLVCFKSVLPSCIWYFHTMNYVAIQKVLHAQNK